MLLKNNPADLTAQDSTHDLAENVLKDVVTSQVLKWEAQQMILDYWTPTLLDNDPAD